MIRSTDVLEIVPKLRKAARHSDLFLRFTECEDETQAIRLARKFGKYPASQAAAWLAESRVLRRVLELHQALVAGKAGVIRANLPEQWNAFGAVIPDNRLPPPRKGGQRSHWWEEAERERRAETVDAYRRKHAEKRVVRDSFSDAQILKLGGESLQALINEKLQRNGAVPWYRMVGSRLVLGVRPIDLTGLLWWQLAQSIAARRCEAPGCGIVITGNDPRKRHHTDYCRVRANREKKRTTARRQR